MSARRPWAWPFVPIYVAVISMKSWMRRVGLLSTRRLRWPVVSVGAISAGGSGKTPVVIALAKLLKDRGWEVNVLSRGYRRKGSDMERVDLNAIDAAERYGDEPVVIAREAQVPVWVGSNRYECGQRAQDSADLAWHGLLLLDDGFQHRQLARTLDLVLVTSEDLQDSMLPAGNLREGLEALSRADAVIVREDEFEVAGKSAWELVRTGTPVWTVRRKLVFPAPKKTLGAGLRPLAFCGIARPESFQTMLLNEGCGVVKTLAFDDHHLYTMGDIDILLKQADEERATGFATTDKDAVKLTAEMRARLETVGPVMVVTLEVEFVNTYEVMRAVEARIT
ncbi:tetraacyldisaccharide 4'-kinase [Granulicella sp. 5B5]|uniref:tetraacyldisaccharide 4'-kinase n=1 Tax=Granulicella sp. 5B5 TaxID=1617967 RepID=UPI0015F60FBC|nr:tetraacyldisaccharide 4'-kinase [Granulicella sp. 5B5]QMV19292.1 tetraacyldisaccharide 4'-kinase [Granulicella sp. 5B5]